MDTLQGTWEPAVDQALGGLRPLSILIVVPLVPRMGPGTSRRDMGFSVHPQGDPAREETCPHHMTGGGSEAWRLRGFTQITCAHGSAFSVHVTRHGSGVRWGTGSLALTTPLLLSEDHQVDGAPPAGTQPGSVSKGGGSLKERNFPGSPKW